MNETDDDSSTKSTDSLNFDGLLKSTIGEFGRYQKFMMCLLCIPACFLSAWGQWDMVFISYTPSYTCSATSADEYISTNESLANYSVSLNDKECSIEYSYSDGFTNRTFSDKDCLKWNYDTTYFTRTIATQWNLVCNKAILLRTILAVLNVNTVIAVGYSYIQDRWGRKKAFFVNLTVFLVGSCGSLLAQNPVVFTILKFIGGISCMWEIGYCWALEFAGRDYRTIVTTLLTVLYSIATMSLGLIAYLCNTWVQVGFCTSVPFALLYLYAFILPESPRWLLSQGRVEEASAIIEKMAQWNKAKIDKVSLRKRIKSMNTMKKNDAKPNINIFDFFRSKNLRWKMFIVVFVNIVSNQLYYAVPYSLENFEGNLIIAYVLQAAVEAPASLLNLLVLNRIGRVLPLSILLFMGSLCCFLTWPTSDVLQYGAMIFAIVARFFISGSLAVIEQLEGELYPTVARGVGGSVSFVSNALVGVSAQYILFSAEVWNVLPLLILGSLTFIACFVCLFLPETKGNSLPNTVKEAEMQGSVGWKSFLSHFQLKCNQRSDTSDDSSIRSESVP